MAKKSSRCQQPQRELPDFVRCALELATELREENKDFDLPEGHGAVEEPELIQLQQYSNDDLVYESNHAVFYENAPEGVEQERLWPPSGGSYQISYLIFPTVDEEDPNEVHPAAAYVHEQMIALENYPILDDDDHSRREWEQTEQNIEEVANRVGLRTIDRPDDWMRQVVDWFDQNDYSSELESRDGGGGYPDEDVMREALHALKLLDEDTEKEWYGGAVAERRHRSGDVEVLLQLQLRDVSEVDDSWNNADDRINLRAWWTGEAFGEIITPRHTWSFEANFRTVLDDIPQAFMRTADRLDDVSLVALILAMAATGGDPTLADTVREHAEVREPERNDKVRVIEVQIEDRTYEFLRYRLPNWKLVSFQPARVNPRENPPQWVRDEAIWERAKEQVLQHPERYDEPWAVVATVYKKMGGRVRRGKR